MSTNTNLGRFGLLWFYRRYEPNFLFHGIRSLDEITNLSLHFHFTLV